MKKVLVLRRKAKEYTNNWVSIALSFVSLVLMVLVGVGVISGDDSVQLSPLFSDTIQAISVVIAGVIQIIKILFKKPEEPVV
jgi:uncharacterized Tic20 family protein